MIYNINWSIWVSSGVVIVLIVFGTITLIVTPTDSASEVHPLIQELDNSTNNETTTSDAEVRKRIDEIYKRKGYSNPYPEDYPEDVSEEVKPRIDAPRRNRPLQKIGKDFDPTQSYVIRHSNGSLAYVFPEKLVASPTSSNSVKSQPEGQAANNSSDSSNSTLTFRSRRCSHENCKQDSITFPDHDARSEQHKSIPPGNESCNTKQGLCLRLPNYPAEEVNQIMNEHFERYAELFGNDVISPEGDKLVPRFDTSDDEFLCPSIEKLIHPQAYTEDGNNALIVNTDKYKQGVRIEKCGNVDRPCNKVDGLSGLYTTACKQIFHYRTLVSIDLVTRKPINKLVKLPSCCKCVIRPIKGVHHL